MDFKLNLQCHRHLNWVFDLETLGTKQDSIVTEISAVGFDIATGEVEAEKTVHISVDDQVSLGRKVSSGTLAFWLTQSEEAQEKLLLSMDEHCYRNALEMPLPVAGALYQLFDFIRTESARWGACNNDTWYSSDPLVWGNGISFDVGKVQSLADITETKVPWVYWAERDARTLVDLMPQVKREVMSNFEGIPHYGLDDCKNEIRYISQIYMHLHDLQLAGH